MEYQNFLLISESELYGYFFIFQLAIQMDALEQYLKIEKLDATQITDGSIKHKEQKYGEINKEYSEFETKGKTFINEASKVSLVYRLMHW